jgi:hypothetical protein
LKEVKLIENLQDQAQITLAQFTQIHHPTRYLISFIIQTKNLFFVIFSFGRLLLTLPLLRSIPSIFIEKTYFSRISISKFLVDTFKN